MDVLAAMRAFRQVVEAGSFTRAADRLGQSRAMTSKNVADLEAHLGVRLLNRTTRRISLTEDGARTLETVRNIIDLVEETERHARAHARAPAGRLRISAPMSFGMSHIVPIVPDYLARYPEARIDLDLNDRFVDLVEEGFDFAVRIGTLPDSSLIGSRLATARLYVAASPAYLNRAGRPAALADLTSHRCLDYGARPGRSAWNFSAGQGAARQIPVTSSVTSNNGDALVAMALNGLGLVYQPDFILAPHVRAGRLELVLPHEATRTLDVTALHPGGRHVPLKTRAFADFLKQKFSRVPPWSLTPPVTTRVSRDPRKASPSP